MSYLKRLISGTFHSLGSILVIRILKILISVITVRFLGPTNLGILSIFQNIYDIFSSIINTGMSAGIAKYTAEYKNRNKNNLEAFLSTALSSIFLISLSVAILYFCISDTIANRIYNEPIIASLMKISSITLVLSAIITFEEGFLQGLQKIKYLAVFGIINTVISLPLTYIFIVKLGLIGTIIASIIGALINIILYLRFINWQLKVENIKLKIEINKNYIKKLFNYSFPIFLGSILLRPARLYGQSYLAIKENFLEVGYFKVAFGLYNLISFIPAAISTPLLPMISEISNTEVERSSDIYSKIIKIVLLLTLPFIILAGLLSKYIILVLYGKEFIEATLITHILIISAFFGSISTLVENLFLGTGETWKILYLNAYMAVVFVLSSYLFITKYGTIGLGMAWLIVDMTILPIYLYYANRNSQINFSYLKPSLTLSLIVIIISIMIQELLDGFQLIIATFIFIISILVIEYKILDNYEKKIIERVLAFISKI